MGTRDVGKNILTWNKMGQQLQVEATENVQSSFPDDPSFLYVTHLQQILRFMYVYVYCFLLKYSDVKVDISKYKFMIYL